MGAEFTADWASTPVGQQATKPVRYVVVCDDWPADRARKHRTHEAAAKHLAGVERDGHCRLPHRIEEIPT